MTQFINTLSGSYPVTESQIRADFPNTSFSVPFIAPAPYKVVFPAPAVYDPLTQKAVEDAPVLTVKGHWEQVWNIIDLDQAEIDAIAEAKRIAAIPVSVTPRQIRQALTAMSLRAVVEASIAGGDQNAKDWWEFATLFERQHPLVLGMAQALGVTDRQLDDLFTLAGSL